MTRKAGGANSEDVVKVKQQLLDLTAQFCDAHLNADYKRLCKKLIDRMARKRPPPFLRGRPEIWAAGIVHALGSMNFLFDKSFEPHVSSADIAAYFGVAAGSASQKASVVKEMFDLFALNTEFMTKQMQEKMAPTFAMMEQMEQLMGGRVAMSNTLGDTIEQGQFIASDSPVQSRFYDLAERYERQGPTPAIEQALRKLIVQDPDFYDSYLMLHTVLAQQGRDAEGEELLDTAYQRALARITDARGNWPPALEWGWLENRHIIRTFLNKALAEWTAGRTDAALDLLRKLLRSNPGDNIGARNYILAILLGMTFEEFENTFSGVYGYDALKMMDWFDKNTRRFPKEFDWWKQAVDYEE
jgi:tetratricopeptide (TPR) repeat protein